MRTRISVAIFAALVGCGSSNNVTCGDGTTLVDGTCELGSGSGGSGTGDTCGSGTTLQGTTCVATGGGDATAPTISMITPPDAGIYGHVAFEIDGTGFAGDNVSSLAVFFGDTTNQDCEAIIGPASPTAIVGEVPVFCALDVQVSVITNLGTATTPFHYDAVLAGEGFGGPEGAGGALFLIDPFVGLSEELGYLSDANMNPYDFDAMDFDSTGTTLYVATSGNSPADLAANTAQIEEYSLILSVDLTTGDVTALGNATDGTDNYIVSDVKLSNGTLYGWAYDVDAGTEGLVTISTTTGAITPVGTLAAIPETEFFESAGMAFDGSGALNVAANGAGPDDPDTGFTEDGATGELDTVDTTTGAVTATATTLDWTPFAGELFGLTVGATVDSMATFQGQMLAVVDDGSVGLSGATLAIIDPTQTPVVGALFELPAETGEQSYIDGIAIPPTGGASIGIAAKSAAHATWLQPPARSTQPVKHATRRAHRIKH
ncbi:MAG TPA: IPT/TIG domain-containing protein [Kofleriaceae bacterium]|jgi:hypothetical protein